MIIKRFAVIIIVSLFPFFVKGQSADTLKRSFNIETDFGYGYIYAHHKSIEYFVEDHIRPFDLKITKSTNGEKYWHQLYRYPEYGLGFYRSNLGNDDIYGHANAIYSFIKVPIIGSSNKTHLSWQFAFGASYLTEHFNIETNPQNLAIASNINMYLDFSLQSTIPIYKRLALTNAIRFTHFSNGKIESPNKGLNIVSGTIGLQYQLNKNPERIVVELPPIQNKNEYSIIYSAGIKTMSHYEEGYFYASSLILDYNRNYSHKSRLDFGIDIFFDATNKQYSDKLEKADIINSDLYQIGLHAAHEMVISKFSMVFSLGGYVYTPVEVLAPFYTRIGLRYRIKNKIITNFTLKSHYAKASFLEWGIGYVI